MRSILIIDHGSVRAEANHMLSCVANLLQQIGTSATAGLGANSSSIADLTVAQVTSAVKFLTKGITKWGIRDARELAQWNPRLRFLERSFVGALYQRIPSAAVRLMWRLVNTTPMRNYDVLNRFAF